METKNLGKKIVYQFSMEGEFIRMFSHPHSAAKILGYNYKSIQNCCTGTIEKYKGFVWRYEGSIFNGKLLEYNYKNIMKENIKILDKIKGK